MPQGRMTEAEAWELAGKQKAANDARRGIPNNSIYATGQSRADYARTHPNPTAAPERKVNMQSGMGNTNVKKVYAEKPSPASSLLTNNPLEFIKNNPGKMNDALGYGTSLLTRGLAKGNTKMIKTDYVDRLRGSDVFRKLDPASQGHVLKAYQQWLDSQSAFNARKREQMDYEARTADIGKTF